MASDVAIIGAHGEEVALEWLRKNGFLIVARNWRSGRYEIDIIAQKGFSLHFVEVKTRRAKSLSSPEDAITQDKSRSLMRAINIYLGSHPTMLEPQLDLIAVEVDNGGDSVVRYIPHAIQPNW